MYDKDYIIAKEERMSTHFVVGSNHPLVNEKNLSIYDVVKHPFVLTEKKMGYRKVLEKELAKRSLEINPVLEIGRTDIITKTLEKVNLIAFLPDFVTAEEVAEGKLKYLDVTDCQIDIWKQLIYHRNKWMSKHFEAFIQFVMEYEFGK